MKSENKTGAESVQRGTGADGLTLTTRAALDQLIDSENQDPENNEKNQDPENNEKDLDSIDE